MNVRAAVLERFGEPLAITEVELDEPREGEVLVRLEACGVCHTDMYTASGADPSGYAPAVLGHEGAGIVERLGPGVESLSPGDKVVTLFSPQCRKCIHCLDPRTGVAGKGETLDVIPRFLITGRRVQNNGQCGGVTGHSGLCFLPYGSG